MEGSHNLLLSLVYLSDQVYDQMIQQIEDETGSLPEDLPRGISAEVAAANTDVQNIIAPRLAMLMEIANSFLMTIMESIDSVPYGIRWICKQIRSLTKVRKSPSKSASVPLLLTSICIIGLSF